jgi:uncharacterized protein
MGSSEHDLAGPTDGAPPTGPRTRAARWVAGHRTAVILVAAAVTAALAVPLLTMAPDELASVEPDGPVFEARDALEERLGEGVVGWFFIIEARDGDILDRDGLLAVHERSEALREDPVLAPLLSRRSDPADGTEVLGVVSLAGAVDRALAEAGLGGLEEAPEEAVRAVASGIIDAAGSDEIGLSVQAERDAETGTWSAPALLVSVLGDGARIEGRADAGFGSDVAVERVGRDVQEVLRASPELDVWGVALDQSLTASEQGEAAGPFIGFTVLAIVLLVGLAFRSYWTLAVVGGALVTLLVWLLGLSNLVGLKEDQILSTVVPIAMIAFGVDYAFHAVGRLREERRDGREPRAALSRGLAGVAPALVLALVTGVAAFLANTASSIESIVQFGVAAAIALAAAFVVLGVVVPAAVSLIEERVPTVRPPGGRLTVLAASAGAAAVAMTAVLFTVFLSPPVGLAMLAGYLVLLVVAPAWIASRVARGDTWPVAAPRVAAGGRARRLLVRTVTGVAARRAVVLPLVAVASAAAAFYAVQVPASFDVEDFFAQDTDFVIALDKLDDHVGDQGGEPATIYVVTDLTDPAAVDAVERAGERIAELDTALLAHDASGRVRVDASALAVLDGTSRLTEVEASQVLAPPDEDGLMGAVLTVALVGSRAQENVEAARDLLEPLVEELDAELAALHRGSQATLTGTPIVRQASLDAVSRSLRVSLPIAVLLCLLCAWAFMRSLRYALVSMVPILLVVAWLYAFMYLAGFSVNLVTATIGAISIGIGIDFATHMTMRYREELAVRPTRLEALRDATAGTGLALVGSSVSSIVGFAILALAPMPMFASFGLLTAVMIALALVASLLVLPGLLVLVSRDPGIPQPAVEGAVALVAARPRRRLLRRGAPV